MDNGAPTPGTEFKHGDTISPGQPTPSPEPAAPQQVQAVEPAAPPAAAPTADPPQAAPTTELQPTVQPVAPTAAPTPAETASQTASEPVVPTPPPPLEQFAPQEQAFYNPAADAPYDAPAPAPTGGQPVSWTAAEFLAHQKSAGWYIVLALGALVLAAAVQLLFKDTFSSAVVLIVAILFGAYAARSPRDLQYELDDRGITIGQKFRPYGLFRSFSLVDDGPLPSIVLMPLKRFGMSLTIYFEAEDAEPILGTLSAHLPMSEHKNDPIDGLMHRIRF